ncbi:MULTISPECIES: MerR family transcriptional regulator [Bacteria]|uniref:MerR family transcriptional regulator n=1 Tax=Bacteria TaxID=2 RepID=UPI0007D75896
MEVTDKPVAPKEASVSLGIGDSTLRKWCLAIEHHGYNFPRTDNNRRVFFDKDMVILRQLRQLVQVQNLSLENASLIVVTKLNEEASEEKNTEIAVPSNRYDEEVIQELLDHIERQEKFNKKLLQRLDEQQKYIEERLEKREQLIKENIKESQETKKLLLEAKEEKKQRKGFMKWFSKD